MHSAQLAHDTLNLLWNNYLTLAETVDPELMPDEKLEQLVKMNAKWRPFRISAWLCQQSYFLSAWTLFEYYARTLCDRLEKQTSKTRMESTIAWIGRSMELNRLKFENQEWFESANSLRNLIVHSGTHVTSPRSKGLLDKAKVAFPEIEIWPDGYVRLESDQLSDLRIKIADFIDSTATLANEAS
ncbi:MAG: hypothetical protein JNM18_15105 [Planctomycetaceae bacterium]|nr:hypothetical protein [Planctomycetaceae bacterium]